MDVYADYKNWKHENFEMINTLIKIKSNIISRFSHVILVVDYLYDKRQKDGQDLDPDLEVIFETGFNYIHDHFLTITSILEQEYRNDIVQMDKNSKTINLLLYIHDFENELLNNEDYEKSDYDMLLELEDEVDSYIKSHTEVPDSLFAKLDEITHQIFEEYYGVNDIMYDIAIELKLLSTSDEFEDFDIIFGKVEAHD